MRNHEKNEIPWKKEWEQEEGENLAWNGWSFSSEYPHEELSWDSENEKFEKK